MNTEYNAGWAACEAFYAAHNRVPTDPQLKPVEAASESAEAVQELLAGDPEKQSSLLLAECRLLLIRLMNEANGSLYLNQVAMRELIGNTNFHCLATRIEEAREWLKRNSP